MDFDGRHVLIDITKSNQISTIRNTANTRLNASEISNKKLADVESTMWQQMKNKINQFQRYAIQIIITIFKFYGIALHQTLN